MNKIFVGHITMTHGIQGELKFYTDFEKKDNILKKDFPIYINGNLHFITKVRSHKNYYLITIDHLEDINLVEDFRNQDVYIKREDLKLKENEFLDQDLLGLQVYENNNLLGKITNLRYNKSGLLLEVKNSKSFFIPFQDYFVENIDWEKKIIYVKHASELMI